MKKQTIISAMLASAGYITASSAAFAADYAAEIGAATTESQANMTLVAVGLIGLAAITFGLGHLLGWFKH
ncbi:hypothetical protein [Shewanella algae]|uniref:hypothetical protein n=1 Tax=Shewanella algae TaxID=38313 RepID=UPI001F4552C7|nr:hypothetical protein [Shewanella algae]MCE9783715.1 hypothetical protein [Shewanella algae]MDC8852770.1 hypothetical protein [Shewanella algae]